jgi:hypothetical protein
MNTLQGVSSRACRSSRTAAAGECSPALSSHVGLRARYRIDAASSTRYQQPERHSYRPSVSVPSFSRDVIHASRKGHCALRRAAGAAGGNIRIHSIRGQRDRGDTARNEAGWGETPG